jgi:ATP-dependent protease ClpP protease subunit
MSSDHKIDQRIKAQADDPVMHMHEYDVDLQSNHIFLFGSESYSSGHESAIEEPGIDYTIANRFIRNINLCMRVNPNKPIVIHMKTCGGDWVEGMSIYDAIKSCPFPVTILNYTHAVSMSSIILQAANKRVMMPHSYFMFHEGSLGYQGNYKNVISAVEFDKNMRKQMIDIYTSNMKKTGSLKKKSVEAINRFLSDQMNKKADVFLTAQQTVNIGLADSVFNYNWESLTDYTPIELERG